MSKYSQKYSPNMDQTTYQLNEIAQEDLVKIYPYELSKTDDSRAFIQELTTSIAFITQDNFNINTTKHSLKIDDNGNYYFEVLTDEVQQTLLDESAKSTYSKELKVEPTMTLTSNQFYDADSFKPMIAVIGSPIKLLNGISDKDVFVISTSSSSNIFDTEEFEKELKYGSTQNELFEFNLIHINSIEAQYNNSKVLFTTHENINKDVSSFDGQKGISLGIENQTLISTIKVKGIVDELDSNGDVVNSEYGDIDLITKSGMVPFKFTPTSVDDKLTMYADWFDYDSVLPLFYGYMGQSRVKLDDIIINPTHPTSIDRVNDLKMVKDMLIVSAGFASSWDFAPVITSGTEVGKIKPDFRIGYLGLKAAVIAGKDPIKVVDGIYENHIRKNPGFLTNKDRFQPVKGLINALSRYIYSSYCIGKGQNSYNQVYLPWYFDVDEASQIKINPSPVDIPNPDAGTTDSVDTYVLDELFIKAKSIYFNDNFSSLEPELGSSLIKAPSHIRISNQVLVQTDRKLTVPQVPMQIAPLNKLPLPGDIDTMSSTDLSYIWFLPISDKDKLDKLMLSELKTIINIPAGTRVDVKLDRNPDGIFWDQAKIDIETLKVQAGKIITHATSVTKQETIGFTYALFQRDAPGPQDKIWEIDWINIDNGRWYKNFSPRRFLAFNKDQLQANISIRQIISEITGVPLEHIVKPNITYNGTDGSHNLSGKVDFEYQEFTTAVVETTTTTTKEFSYGKREVLFDKLNWKKFLTNFGLISSGIKKYNFDTEDGFKIKQIDEIMISSVWGNELELFFGTAPSDYIKVKLINQDNETLAMQKIIFT